MNAATAAVRHNDLFMETGLLYRHVFFYTRIVPNNKRFEEMNYTLDTILLTCRLAAFFVLGFLLIAN